jgi:hypothetical protein
MHHRKLSCQTSSMLLALSISCAAGAQVTDPPRMEIVPGIDPTGIQVKNVSCARPFERRGTVALEIGYSGSVAEFTTPDNAILEIRRIKTTLRVAGLSASAIGTRSNDVFAWHPMHVEAGIGTFAAGQEGAIHADRASLVKIEINRSGSIDAAALGDYALSGCLVDRIPERMRIPDMHLPRLPPKVLTPLEPVEQLKPARKPQIDR